MVDLRLVIEIVVGLTVIGGVVVSIAVMQTRQNMNIDFLEKKREEDIKAAEKRREEDLKAFEERRKETVEANNKRFEKLEDRQSKYAHYQMEIEKDISSMTAALTHILKGIDELKRERKNE